MEVKRLARTPPVEALLLLAPLTPFLSFPAPLSITNTLVAAGLEGGAVALAVLLMLFALLLLLFSSTEAEEG